jgi:acetyl esterase
MKPLLFVVIIFEIFISCSRKVIPTGAWLSTPESISSFRKQVESMNPDTSAIKLFKIEDKKIQLEGRQLNIRVYYPGEGTNKPALIYVHGACWVAGSLNSHDEICRYLAKESGVIVIAIDYRLGPEFKYPSAHNDVFDATKWIGKHAAELGIDPSKIAIGGESAGAYFAAATALRTVDEPGSPVIKFQLLVYAALDGAGSSWKECKDLYFENAKDARSRYGSPLWVENLIGVPPTYNIFGQFEISRAEEELYIKKLAEKGNYVKSFMIENTGHDVGNWLKISGNLKAHHKAVEFISEGFSK